MLLSAVISVFLFNDVALGANPRTIELFTWIDSGALEVSWALKLDTLTAVMMIVVTVVSAMIHIYSIGYMHGDAGVPRFFAYLNLFTFFMLMLVTADNLVQLFFGWEGVGLASYLLIGFWYDRPAANAAAIKAFIVNRVGDFGFMLGIFAIFVVFQSVHLDTIFAAVPSKAGTTLSVFGGEFDAITVICLLLFVGAMGKSAQLGLHTWLPDAMEGPTPVSALIHAATMVTAGIFMVARLSPLFEYSETALTVVTVVGASTAHLRRHRRLRADRYQAGDRLLHLLAVGLHAFRLRGVGLFGGHVPPDDPRLLQGAAVPGRRLGHPRHVRRAGHAPHGRHLEAHPDHVRDHVDRLPGAGRHLALRRLFLQGHHIGSRLRGGHGWRRLCLLDGHPGRLADRLLFVAAAVDDLPRDARADETVMAHVHESPKVMLVPLLGLAAGAMFAGYVGFDYFVGEATVGFWGNALLVLAEHPALAEAHLVPIWVKYLPLVVAAGGIGLAFVMYVLVPALPGILAQRLGPVYRFVHNKWYFDELYDFLFVRPAFYLGRNLWKTGDGALIDGLGPDGVAEATRALSRRAGALQSGYLFHYAFAMLAGVAGLVTWYLVTRAG